MAGYVALLFQGGQELANISSSIFGLAQSRYTFLHSRHQTRCQRLDSPRPRVDLCACLAFPRAICARHHLLRERDGKRFNSGTSTTAPFLTITKAANLTKPGDIVNVMNGTYGPFIISHSGSQSGGYIAYGPIQDSILRS